MHTGVESGDDEIWDWYSRTWLKIKIDKSEYGYKIKLSTYVFPLTIMKIQVEDNHCTLDFYEMTFCQG